MLCFIWCIFTLYNLKLLCILFSCFMFISCSRKCICSCFAKYKHSFTNRKYLKQNRKCYLCFMILNNILHQLTSMNTIWHYETHLCQYFHLSWIFLEDNICCCLTLKCLLFQRHKKLNWKWHFLSFLQIWF